MKTLLLATHNEGKVEEFREMFSVLDIEVKSAADFDLAEPNETESTFVGNALIKARAACEATGLPSLADDSGLCIDALNGAPGVYTADWAETEGHGQSGRDFNIAMERVHRELGDIKGDETAHFIAVLALVYPDANGTLCEETFEGRFDGTLTWPMRGDKGHGYDPIFVPNGYDMTAAEMEPSDKNATSHRAKAVARFVNYLSSRA